MRWCLGAVIVLAIACGATDGTDLCAPLIPGVPVVGGPPDIDKHVVAGSLEELWTVGGTLQGPDLVAPAAFSGSSSGALAVVDYALAEVLVFDEAGDWSSWGARGPGPGELMMPVAAAWSEDRLAVFDIGHAKVVFLSSSVAAEPDLRVNPAFAAPVVSAGEISMVAVRPDGSVILQYPLSSTSGDGNTAALNVLMLRPGSDVPDTLTSSTVHTFRQNTSPAGAVPGSPIPQVGIGPDGWWAASAADGTYRVIVRDSAGRAVRQLCRPVSALPLEDRERGRHLVGDRGELAALLAGLPHPPALGAIGRLLVGSRGEVWVDRKRSAAFSDEILYGVPGTELDVFDSEGRYRGQLAAPAGARIQALAGDRAWGIRFGDYGEALIIGFRVRWAE